MRFLEGVLNILWTLSIPALLLFASKAYFEVLSFKYVYPQDWPVCIGSMVVILGITAVSAQWNFAQTLRLRNLSKTFCMIFSGLACIPTGALALLTLAFGTSRLDQRDPPLSSIELLVGWLNGLSQFAPMLALVFAGVVSISGKSAGWKRKTVTWTTVAGVIAFLGAGTALIVAGHILKSQG